MINYISNSNSDSDNDIKFTNVDLSYNKLSIRLLVNNSIIYTTKKHVVEVEDRANETSKVIFT